MAAKLTFSDSDFYSYIKVSVALQKSALEILNDLRRARPTSTPSRAAVYRWMKHFESGNSAVGGATGKQKIMEKTDEKMVARVKAIMDEDARVTIQEILETLSIASGTVWKILKHRIGYHKVCARWVPHIFTPEKKGVRVAYSQALLQVYDNCDSRWLD